MATDYALEKTNRINLLMDFYESLLTEKQCVYLRHYYHDDYSLAEIAELFAVSRQAVFEQIKRAQTMLEQYEAKLGLLGKHERRQACATLIRGQLEQVPDPARGRLLALLDEWLRVD